MIIDYRDQDYQRKLHNKNGAYWYSKELAENIIPYIRTDRPWVTVMVKGKCYDRAIFFIHNNLRPERYDWLKDYEDLVLVCGVPETCEKVAHLGTAVYLPLSIDVDYVKGFRAKKTRGTCFAGRPSKKKLGKLPGDIDYLEGLPRNELLERLARYKECYAVGRLALEAKVLGCKILPYDYRYPDVKRWEVKDNSEMVPVLQGILDDIDGGGDDRSGNI